ncbi:lipopolysaccharide biosynthesis protein [Enterococcus cecorum]|uniref:lipopolysaccharide biosynthesis protein n=2 Tax=Enterococcus cecorum TaxID=44008 RepID=UPI000A773393|nr:lipopolysaccharide biosynthesis protein [Enterococcus cecorum]CAI3359741.1 lipopolysaccharide biosynthesis protein [Enterococcus cecorum]CAI3437432.1 lipopolysaccharide biosynthesis protein [Enterococcus cecorum]CAI3490617.1 lipopolysaccharide biosynthesis protein [Enterococcus cecorum]
MKNFRDLLYRVPNNSIMNTLWYPLGMMMFSASSIILLIFITRFFGSVDSGIFAISWAVCQQMYSLGLFGTRNYQIADVENKFSFSQYYSSKFFSAILMLIGCIIYGLVLKLSWPKLLMSFLLTFLMIGEVFADVFAGHLQKMDRNAQIGKSYFFRILLYDVLFIFICFLFNNIYLAILFSTLISFSWIWIVDYYYIVKDENSKNKEKVHLTINFKNVLIECIPILLSAFLTNFIINIPKNAIELYSTNQLQAVYNILFTPTSIIALVSSIIFMPMYTKISQDWYKKRYKDFLKKITNVVIFICLFTIVVLIIAYFLGIPVLSFVYNVELAKYKFQFLLLVLSGGIVSISWLLVYLLTVFNRQILLVYIYGFVSVVSNLLSNYLVKLSAIEGASISYFLSSLFINILLVWCVVVEYKKLAK